MTLLWIAVLLIAFYQGFRVGIEEGDMRARKRMEGVIVSGETGVIRVIKTKAHAKTVFDITSAKHAATEGVLRSIRDNGFIDVTVEPVDTEESFMTNEIASVVTASLRLIVREPYGINGIANNVDQIIESKNRQQWNTN